MYSNEDFTSGNCSMCNDIISGSIYFAFDQRFCGTFCRQKKINEMVRQSNIEYMNKMRKHLKKTVSEVDIFKLSLENVDATTK